ncbi:MAG TPA: hypothetical protein VH082_12150 [Rudaea sp.]|jgi:hypothetical protein|nr:hypothetical protein [Rudaea sp.]
MKAFYRPLLLLLATFALASCGGGGGGSSSAFSPPGSDSISISASPSASIGTNSFTALTVVVKKNDGSAEDDGTTVTATLSPANMGTVTASQGTSGGSSATNTLSGGKTTFYYNSTNLAGNASISFSLPAGLHGNPNSASTSFNVTVVPGNTQDPRLQLSATATTLPLNPFNTSAYPFPGNYPGSPYVSEVTVTFRHSNGELVNGTTKVNVSIDPVTVAGFSTLDDPTTPQTDPTKPDGNEFLTIFGNGFIDVTGGNGVIFVHSFNVPGTAVLTVTAIDPDSGQTISSQLTITVAGASSALPSSITAFSEGPAYVTGSGGPQSAIVNATVTDGNNANVPDPTGVDNVEFTIVGPAGNDARLSGINAAGVPVTGTTVDTQTHNGVASITVLSGSVEGPVQIRATADRADNNVDNGIQDGVSSTATVTISNGKLFSLTIIAPDADAVNASGVSANVVENPAGSGNYQLTVSAIGVDNRDNPVVPDTQIGFGGVDSPQIPNASGNLISWFSISGNDGDPQEGGTLFTSASGHFTTAGGGAGPGDTLLVIGKSNEGAPAGNDDLESAVKITSINSATSLNVVTPFNLNDRTGAVVDNHGVLPYIIGRSEFTSINSPGYTDSTTGVAVTSLNYPSSAVGKAVAIWAQGTGTDTTTSPGRTDVVTDVKILVLPGMSEGAFMTASPDPIQGNTKVSETVCYYDGNGRPIANFDINFAFDFAGGGTGGGVGSGSVDNTQGSGKLENLTNSSGCAVAQLLTASIPPSESGLANVTFSAGPTNIGGSNGGATAFVTVPIVVSAAQIQLGSTCPTVAASKTPTTLPISLSLLDANGSGISGQSITGTCTVTSASGTITTTGGTTDANGRTTVFVTVGANADTVKGVCQYSSASYPTLVASVAINGGGSCQGGFSPQPP